MWPIHYWEKCLISGAASGVGRATAVLAAKQGVLLCVCDINEEGINSLDEKNGDAQILAHEALDIANYNAVKSFADDIRQHRGSIDIVTNSAGIATWGAIRQLHNQNWRQLIDGNLMGPIPVMECIDRIRLCPRFTYSCHRIFML